MITTRATGFGDIDPGIALEMQAADRELTEVCKAVREAGAGYVEWMIHRG